MAEDKALYFGCWSDVGHSFHAPNGATRHKKDEIGPWGYGVEDLTTKFDTRQGVATLHHKDGWTALAVHDYTVDDRGNSKSVFLFPAHLDLDEVLFSVVEFFPTIAARVGEITMARR